MKNLAKKSSLKPLFILAILIGLVGCGEQRAKENGEGQHEEDQEVKAPDQIISVDQAKKMFENYTKRRAPLIERYEDSINRYEKKSKDTFDVARYTYYDYKTIKQYLAYIEQEAKLANVEISTLRFYFSNYPDKPNFEGGRKIVHPRQNSIFIMPTIKEDGKDFGFYTADGEPGKRKAVLLTYELDEYSIKGMGAQEVGSEKSYATFVPNLSTSTSKGPSINFYGNRSTILNEGGSAPPPHQ